MAEGNINPKSFRTNTFVLVGVPDLDDKSDYVTDYLEGTLSEFNMNVRALSIHPGVPDRVLVMSYESLDLEKANCVITRTPLEDNQLRVEKAEEMNAVIVDGEDLEGKLTLFFLKLYFQSQFGDNKEIVRSCVLIPKSAEVAVHFTSSEVTRKVLKHQNHMPLPSQSYKIRVKPFFSNFHGRISHNGRTFLQTLEENQDAQFRTEHLWSQKRTPVENKLRTNSTAEEEVVDMTPAHQVRIDTKSMETNVHPLSYPQNFPDMQSHCLPSTATGSSEKTSVAKSDGKKTSGRRLSSSDHHSQMPLNDVTQSLSAFSLNSETNRNAPPINLGPKSKENKGEKKSDDKYIVSVSKAMWNLMKDEIIIKKIEVSYDFEKEILLVENKHVSHFKTFYQEFKGRVIECHIPLDEQKEMVLNSRYAKNNILSLFSDVPCSIDRLNMSLIISGFSQWSVDYIKQKVSEIFDSFEEIRFPNYVSDEDFINCKQIYEGSCPVHVSRDVHHITIIGKRDSVTAAKDYLERMNKMRSHQELERRATQRSVQFSKTQYDLIMSFYTVELDDLLRSVKYVWKPGQEEKVIIEVIGTLTDVSLAEGKLLKMCRSIQTETIDVLAELGPEENSRLIKELSSSSEFGPLHHRQKSFENENKCIIKADVKTETSFQATGSVQNHGRGPETSNSNDVHVEEQKCVFQVRSSLLLEIKNYGNIVEERCDVLVCFAPQDQSLTSTYVGQAFSKAIPGFEKEVSSLPLSANKVAFKKLSFSGSPCLAIALMRLPKTPDAESFARGVLEVLHRTIGFGAHTICFPPLGHGRTMKYSEEFISKNFISPLILHGSYFASTSLNKITFLAPKQLLYERMTSEASANLPVIVRSHESKGSDESFLIIEKKVEIQIAHRNSQLLAPAWKRRLEEMIGGE